MYKYLALLLLIFSSNFLFGFNSSDLTYKSNSLNLMPTVTPTPADPNKSELLVLDKDFVYTSCPTGYRLLRDADCKGNMKIKVSVGKYEKNQSKYEYTISGGRVIGEGAKVIWDMTGAQPGTYQIRIDIEDKNGQKQTETKTIEVRHRYFPDLCTCPSLSINIPISPTEAGETIIFTANASGGSQSNVTYNWSVSGGKIVEGQKTPVIKVATNAKTAGKIVKATVEIGGICEVCQNKIESANVTVIKSKGVKK